MGNTPFVVTPVVVRPGQTLSILYQRSMDAWCDAARSFFANYANVVRLHRDLLEEFLHDLSQGGLQQEVIELCGLNESQADIDVHEFLFPLILISTGKLQNKIEFFVERFDMLKLGYISSPSVLVLLTSCVSGLHRLIRFLPPSLRLLQEFVDTNAPKDGWRKEIQRNYCT